MSSPLPSFGSKLQDTTDIEAEEWTPRFAHQHLPNPHLFSSLTDLQRVARRHLRSAFEAPECHDGDVGTSTTERWVKMWMERMCRCGCSASDLSRVETLPTATEAARTQPPLRGLLVLQARGPQWFLQGFHGSSRQRCEFPRLGYRAGRYDTQLRPWMKHGSHGCTGSARIETSLQRWKSNLDLRQSMLISSILGH